MRGEDLRKWVFRRDGVEGLVGFRVSINGDLWSYAVSADDLVPVLSVLTGTEVLTTTTVGLSQGRKSRYFVLGAAF